MRTQVAIIGASSLLLGQLLHNAGIHTVILESRNRYRRNLETPSSCGGRQQSEWVRWAGHGVGLPLGTVLSELTGGSVMVYGQTEVTRDPMAARRDSGAPIIYGVSEVAIER